MGCAISVIALLMIENLEKVSCEAHTTQWRDIARVAFLTEPNVM